MKKKIGIAFALALLGVGVALATPFPTAFRVGSGAQIVPRTSAPGHATGTGVFWVNSSDSNKLYYTDPSDTSSAVGSVSGGTLATAYDSTPSDNRITVNSTGGPVLIEPSSSGQGALLQCKTSSGTALLSVADNAAATLYGNAADSGSNVGTHVGTATTLTSSRAYLSIDNGSTAQWKAYTTAGNVRTLQCTAGTSAQVAGSGGLNLAGSISSDANIGISDGSPMSFVSGQTAANGAAYLLNTANTLGGSDLVLDVQNNNTDVFTVDGSGAITTPSVGIAALSASGTPSSSTFLRGDNTWASAGGGSTGNYSFSSNAMDLTGAAEMSIAPTTATGVTIGQRLKVPEVVTTSGAPTLTGGASGFFGTITGASVTGTNHAGTVTFTTGTLGSAPTGAIAATAEVLKITFSSFTAPNGCVVRWFSMGNDNDGAAQGWAQFFDNYTYDLFVWGVCSTTTCSMYMNVPSTSPFASTTAYKLGYTVDCF